MEWRNRTVRSDGLAQRELSCGKVSYRLWPFKGVRVVAQTTELPSLLRGSCGCPVLDNGSDAVYKSPPVEQLPSAVSDENLEKYRPAHRSRQAQVCVETAPCGHINHPAKMLYLLYIKHLCNVSAQVTGHKTKTTTTKLSL